MTTIVLIPAYNEARTLREVVRGALLHADAVLVVDDGSTDGSAQALCSTAVQVLTHAQNEGKSASLVDGFVRALACGATRVVTMDADGQHAAADIPRLLRAADVHPGSIVIGARVRRRAAAPHARRIANRLADFGVSWAAGYRVVDSQSGQRVYPASLLRALDLGRLSRDGFTLESEIIVAAARIGCRAIGVPIDAVYAAAARKSYFRPVPHIAGISTMLARNVIGDGFRLRGLWASLCMPPTMFDDAARRTDAPAPRPASVPQPGVRDFDALQGAQEP
ncbi:MAG: glycosyltransferase family 2 protein [Casimicrobiaceae bacterium]